MKKNKNKCDKDLLNRFFDQELEPGEHTRVSEHLKHCSSCQNALQDSQSLSALFTETFDRKLSQADLGRIEKNVTELVQNKRELLWIKLKSMFGSEKFLIPASVTAAVFVIFFSIIGYNPSVPGPSALVKSCTGDVSSLMIIETPESRQTIIWFNETQ
ncbi:MAG: zf-HC2 domain-containing protein [Desulfobacteraceae bacterium]|nr:zf-HC2 domain-containing protein [Desulfobacteraceae bacterium]